MEVYKLLRNRSSKFSSANKFAKVKIHTHTHRIVLLAQFAAESNRQWQQAYVNSTCLKLIKVVNSASGTNGIHYSSSLGPFSGDFQIETFPRARTFSVQLHWNMFSEAISCFFFIYIKKKKNILFTRKWWNYKNKNWWMFELSVLPLEVSVGRVELSDRKRDDRSARCLSTVSIFTKPTGQRTQKRTSLFTFIKFTEYIKVFIYFPF